METKIKTAYTLEDGHLAIRTVTIYEVDGRVVGNEVHRRVVDANALLDGESAEIVELATKARQLANQGD
jgi:hypothetical protein